MKYTLPFSVLLLFFSFNARAQYLTLSSGAEAQVDWDNTPFENSAYYIAKAGYTYKHFYLGTSFTNTIVADRQIVTSELGVGFKVFAYKPENKVNVFTEGNAFFPVFNSPEGYVYESMYFDPYTYYYNHKYRYLKDVKPRYDVLLGVNFNIKPIDIYFALGRSFREYIIVKGESHENGSVSSMKDEKETREKESSLIVSVGLSYNLDLRKKEKKVEE